jgi:rhodanese-related sulfurtransferase
MVGTQVDDRRLGQPRLARIGAEQHREIEPPAAHVPQQRAGRVLLRIQHHARRAGSARAQQRGPDAVTGRRSEPEPQPPDHGRVAPAHRVEHPVGLDEQPAPLGQQHLTRRCHPQHPVGAVEQLHPQLLLELPHGSAQGRLGDVQPLRRARDVALLRDRDEVPDEPQLRLHRRSLWHPNQPVLDETRHNDHPRAMTHNTITREELRDAIEAGDVTVVEALGPKYYEDAHLPGAINIPHTEVRTLAPELLPDKDAPIVTYCASTTCPNSEVAAKVLIKLGYTNVREYVEGKADWQEAGFPVESGAPLAA